MKGLLLFTVIGFVSCLNPGNEQQNRLSGTWSFLDDEQNYVEMYLDKEYISFFHEKDGNFEGNMEFEIRNDSLFFNNMSYAIEYTNDCTVILRNNKYHLTLHRISPPIVPDQTKKINPFYLRRCNYLVNQGIITMEEAIDYLRTLESNTKKKGPKEKSILQ